MMKSRLVQRRMRPSPMGALFGLLLVCLLSSSWPSSFECSTFAFAFSTSNPKAMHKMMMICPDPSQLLVRYAAPLSDKKNDNEVQLSSPVTRSQTQQMSSSRRHVISAITSTIIAASTTISAPQSAYADVTNKIASTTALRSLSNLQTQLPIRLKPLAQSNNYVGIKQCLREPPLDGIRKNMLTLVRGGEDGPKAGELLIAYKRLISALEDMDATATLGMQGRNNKNMNDPFLLSLQYDEVEKALGLFIEVGAAAASIPLQEDNGRQTKIGSIDVRSGEVTPRVL